MWKFIEDARISARFQGGFFLLIGASMPNFLAGMNGADLKRNNTVADNVNIGAAAGSAAE
jgi:hypothetical protein